MTEQLHKTFKTKPLYYLKQGTDITTDGLIIETNEQKIRQIKKTLTNTIKDIHYYTQTHINEENLQKIIQGTYEHTDTLTGQKTVKKLPKQASEAGRLIGIGLHNEAKPHIKIASRYERLIQERTISELRSWAERIKAKNHTTTKYMSQGWKRTINATKPELKTPKINLSATTHNYAQIINNPFTDGIIILKMIIGNDYQTIVFQFDKKRFKDGIKVAAPSIKIDHYGKLEWSFSVIYDYQYAAFSEKYIIGIDVGIKQYATVSIIEQATKRIIKTTTLSQRAHSLYNSIKATNKQIKALQLKGKKQEAVLHRAKNKCKKRELAILAGQEVADLSYSFGNAVVIIEDLSWVGNTMVNGRWNRGEFVKWVEHFVGLNGGRVFRVSAAGTSQECSNCGAQVLHDDKKRLVSCSCGLLMDRDVNASVNVAVRGLKPVEKAIITRRKSKNFVKRARRLSVKPVRVLKYPGRDRTKNCPTKKRVKVRKAVVVGEVFNKKSSPVGVAVRVAGDVDIKHTINRTLEKQLDFSDDNIVRNNNIK